MRLFGEFWAARPGGRDVTPPAQRRAADIDTCATTKNRPFLKIYYYSNTLSLAHYVSYNRVDALEAFRRRMVNNRRFLVVAHVLMSAAYFYVA